MATGISSCVYRTSIFTFHSESSEPNTMPCIMKVSNKCLLNFVDWRLDSIVQSLKKNKINAYFFSFRFDISCQKTSLLCLPNRCILSSYYVSWGTQREKTSQALPESHSLVADIQINKGPHALEVPRGKFEEGTRGIQSPESKILRMPYKEPPPAPLLPPPGLHLPPPCPLAKLLSPLSKGPPQGLGACSSLCPRGSCLHTCVVPPLP